MRHTLETMVDGQRRFPEDLDCVPVHHEKNDRIMKT